MKTFYIDFETEDGKLISIVYRDGIAYLQNKNGERISRACRATITQEDDGYDDFYLLGITGGLDKRFVQDERSFDEVLKSLEEDI